MQTKTNIETFVNSWVAQNVRTIKGLSNLPQEVDRLAASLTVDGLESPPPQPTSCRSESESTSARSTLIPTIVPRREREHGAPALTI